MCSIVWKHGEHLTHDQKQQARQLFQQFKQLPSDRRQAINRAIRNMRGLTPEQRDQLIRSDQYRSAFFSAGARYPRRSFSTSARSRRRATTSAGIIGILRVASSRGRRTSNPAPIKKTRPPERQAGRIGVKIRIKIKGSGHECPLY